LSYKADGWYLFLNALKEDNEPLAAVLKTFIPIKIDKSVLLVYSNSDFKKKIVYERINLINVVLRKVTGLCMQISDKPGKRVEVPVLADNRNSNVEITARLKRVIFWDKKDYYILALRTSSGEEIIAVGKSDLKPTDGAKYRIKGSWIYHPNYGNEIKLDSIQPVIENDIVKFLSSGIIKGIKETIAENIVSTFGEDTLNVLNKDIDRLIEVKGIGRKTLEAIKKSYAQNRVLRDVALFFSKYDIPLSQIYKMYKTYGTNAVQIVSQNPYKLIEDIDGIGFKKADAIAEKIGIESVNPYRIQAGIEFTLKNSVKLGNVFLPRVKLIHDTAELLDLPEDLVETGLHRSGGIVLEDGKVYLKDEYQHERGTAEEMRRIWNSAKPLNFEFASNLELSSEQRKAVENVFKYGISVVTGLPGTGKTTVISTIVKSATNSGYSIALASPTGKAAVRMKEVSDYPAQTIHRLIGLPDNFHDIKYDVVVVDESSMLDIGLAFYLLSAVKSGTHVAFVGDVDQLPSVGPGTFLSDIISIFPTTFLRRIYRQGEGSGIAKNAALINQGKWIEPSSDFVFIEKEGERDILDFILSYMDRHRDAQVLSPMRRGILGVRNLNRELQNVLNPFPLSSTEFLLRKFGSGDRIMQLSNDYDKEVFNGETGKVVYADDDGLDADFGGSVVSYKRE